MRLLAIGFSIFLLLDASPSAAQKTVGDVLDMGGRRLAVDEVRSLYLGATSTGRTPRGAEVKLNFKADGSVAGDWRAADASSSGTGTYKVDDDGRICVDLKFSRSDFPPVRGCFFVFKIGERYFVSTSETDRGVTLAERTYTR